jgi:hypothetical protein
MIDFRYHLVSLVSVFLALAIGILLGAGPLKEPVTEGVSKTLQQQVEALREDRQALNEQLDSSQAASAHRDEVITSVTPSLVAGRLTDRSVVLVVLPDAATDRIGTLTGQLEAAGASVVGRVDVAAGWTDAERSGEREKLVATLVAGLPAGSPAPSGGSGTDAELAGLLARALVGTTSATAGTPDPAATAILDGLRDADLVSVRGDLDGRAGLAVVLAPGVESATVRTASSASTSPTSPSATRTPPPTVPWTLVVDALDGASEGAVVLGPGSSATSGGVLAAVRDDGELSSAVSTVDTGETAMGDLTAVFALVEQASGEAGSYGFGSGASAPVPQSVLRAAGASPTPTQTP